MATVNPTVTEIGPDVVRVTWTGIVTGDTITAYKAGRVSRASVQGGGTFAGGTVAGMTGSLDDANFLAMPDIFGADVAGKTAAFIAELAYAVTSYKPTVASGAADAVDVTLTVWG